MKLFIQYFICQVMYSIFVQIWTLIPNSIFLRSYNNISAIVGFQWNAIYLINSLPKFWNFTHPEIAQPSQTFSS